MSSTFLKWCLYYPEGKTYTDQDGPPAEAPIWGVICIGYAHPSVGWKVIREYPYYWYHPEEDIWYGSDEIGIIDNLAHNLPMESLKIGRWLNDPLYEATIIRALDEPRAPKKSAKMSNESPRNG